MTIPRRLRPDSQQRVKTLLTTHASLSAQGATSAARPVPRAARRQQQYIPKADATAPIQTIGGWSAQALIGHNVSDEQMYVGLGGAIPAAKIIPIPDSDDVTAEAPVSSAGTRGLSFTGEALLVLSDIVLYDGIVMTTPGPNVGPPVAKIDVWIWDETFANVGHWHLFNVAGPFSTRGLVVVSADTTGSDLSYDGEYTFTTAGGGTFYNILVTVSQDIGDE